MRTSLRILFFISLLFMLMFDFSFAQSEEKKIKQIEERIKRLELEVLKIKDINEQREQMVREIEALKEEIRQLRLEVAMPEIELKSYFGLGPAASKIYYTPRGLSIAGYGEITYENYIDNSKTDRGDVLRFVPYIGYKFTDNIIVNTELEIEHAGIGNVGNRNPEIYVEFLYVDFILHPRFNIRTGLFLIPTSRMNEFHEPPVYFGVLRPDVERFIIPTVWRELGVMVYGEFTKGFSYKAGIVNGLRTDLIGDWIAGGRQRGATINFDKFAGSFGVVFEVVKNLTLASSLYYGAGSDKAGASERGSEDARFSLLTTEGGVQLKNLSIKGLFAYGSAKGNDVYKSRSGRASKVYGWYLEAGYNLIPLINPETVISFAPFVRYEKYNLNKNVFTGNLDPTKDRSVFTIGLDFKPHPQVVIKADYQIRNTASNLPAGKGAGKDEWKIDQFNIGIGFIF
ncbi:outer membrane beta-barrel protein [Candidatus Kryptobacter tengchongensis]|uniref:Outer membrane protein family (DUF1597) n=1 Tax=Kryptobacter tengchongensis TaxID=1643429 RepID=A0A656DB97_KRYT1|nr:hypothetical protein [Candidatus Kryptobacter tengchongensis]CUT04173.1 Outer membrane protein family (DUF1597) [Candidatus Kryptobacter tengchongensis]